MKTIKYQGKIYVEAASKENPDAYKKRTGRCPRGMHTDAKTGKCRSLHDLAKDGQTHILSHPHVSKVKNNYGRTPLHYLAAQGKTEVLKHPDVSKVKDEYGWTPLHLLAYQGKTEVLKHPDVSKVKNNNGNTPLHFLAYQGKTEVLKHPDVSKVKNRSQKERKKEDEQPRKHLLQQQGPVARALPAAVSTFLA